MVVEPLEKSVIARIRSSSAIDSVTQCVIELVKFILREFFGPFPKVTGFE